MAGVEAKLVGNECLISVVPDEIVYKILSNLSYENISNARIVCQHFNKVCQALLKRGFIRVDKLHAACQKQVKLQLPRRESERRNHPLARHVDILGAIETRLSLLGMTYMKYIDLGLCTFIPGKVLDELFHVLRLVQTVPKPPRAHEVLQELRDISSMAMEHFDEKIVPLLKQKMSSNQLVANMPLSRSISSSAMMPSYAQGVPTSVSSTLQSAILPMRQDINRIQQQVRTNGNAMSEIKKDLKDCKGKFPSIKKKLFDQEKLLADHNRVVREQNQKISDQDRRIDELNRKVLEYEQKFEDLWNEIRSPKKQEISNECVDNKPRMQDINGNPQNQQLHSINEPFPDISLNKGRPLRQCRKRKIETLERNSKHRR